MNGQASAVLQIAIGLIGEVCLAVLARDSWRVLRRAGARPIGFTLEAATYVLAAAAPFVYRLVLIWQPWLDGALLVPFLLVYLFPGRLISLTGGPTRLRRLWVALIAINNRWEILFHDDDTAASDADWLVAQSAELDAFRTTDSSELVDLWQAKIADRLADGDPEGYAARCLMRNARIDELQSKVFSRFFWPGWDSPRG
jgi:hypothetical protein